MTRRIAVIAGLLAAQLAWADDPAVEPLDAQVAPDLSEGPTDDDPLSPYRARFDVLAERAIGTTSRPVEFNWRRGSAQLALTGSYLVELNNFNSMRGGLLLRLPNDKSIVELGVSRAVTWDSPSSEALAYTPYRQPGRPSRFELDVAVGLPLAEGVVTTVPRFFPAVQMVFVAYGGLRYMVYPQAFAKMRPGQVAGAFVSPSLSDHEIDNLERARLDAMQVDPGRFGLYAGFGNDLYFKSGFFVSPRLLVGVPLLAPATRSELWMWADLSLAAGLAW